MSKSSGVVHHRPGRAGAWDVGALRDLCDSPLGLRNQGEDCRQNALLTKGWHRQTERRRSNREQAQQGETLAITPLTPLSSHLPRSSPCGRASDRTCTGGHRTESEPAGAGPLGWRPGLLTMCRSCAQPVAPVPRCLPEGMSRCGDPAFLHVLPCIQRAKGTDASSIPLTRPASPPGTSLSWGYPPPSTSHLLTAPCPCGASPSPGL
jgi:hypothetical protein